LTSKVLSRWVTWRGVSKWRLKTWGRTK